MSEPGRSGAIGCWDIWRGCPFVAVNALRTALGRQRIPGALVFLPMKPPPHGGRDRVSTKAKLADELSILGRVLASMREEAGIKQSDLASRLGVPASYLSKIENGTRRLDVIELIQIADAMNVDPGDIVRRVAKEMSS